MLKSRRHPKAPTGREPISLFRILGEEEGPGVRAPCRCQHERLRSQPFTPFQKVKVAFRRTPAVGLEFAGPQLNIPYPFQTSRSKVTEQ